jgi:hypothetical protein
MDEENRIENLGEEGYHSLRKMLQGPYSSLTSSGLVNLGSLAGVRK